MAKKDYNKDTIVLDPIMDDEIDDVVIDDRMAEERERFEAMSEDERVEVYLQTKENLWSSHDERDLLEKKIRERDQLLAKAQENEREFNIKISESMKDKRNLENQLAGARDEIKALKSQAGESSRLRGQVADLKQQLKDKETDLQQQLKDKDNAAKNTQLNLERSQKAKTDSLNETIKQLEEKDKKSKAEIKKLKADLKKAEDRADSFEESFGEARDANFAGMIVRDIPREMGIGFETADEKTREEFEAFLSGVRERYLSVACGAIEAADAKILSQETAADELKKAEKELEDSESLEELATQRKEAAKKKFEEARKNFIEAKDEADRKSVV